MQIVYSRLHFPSINTQLWAPGVTEGQIILPQESHKDINNPCDKI